MDNQKVARKKLLVFFFVKNVTIKRLKKVVGRNTPKP